MYEQITQVFYHGAGQPPPLLATHQWELTTLSRFWQSRILRTLIPMNTFVLSDIIIDIEEATTLLKKIVTFVFGY